MERKKWICCVASSHSKMLPRYMRYIHMKKEKKGLYMYVRKISKLSDVLHHMKNQVSVTWGICIWRGEKKMYLWEKKKTVYVFGGKRKKSAASHQIYKKNLHDIGYVPYPTSRRILARKILRCRSLSAKESLITGLFCGKRKILRDMKGEDKGKNVLREQEMNLLCCIESIRKVSVIWGVYMYVCVHKYVLQCGHIYICVCILYLDR